jgi:hypothetical protein
MVAYLDGQFVREIRKYAFIPQSPIRCGRLQKLLNADCRQ